MGSLKSFCHERAAVVGALGREKNQEESQRQGGHPAILCNQYSCTVSLRKGSGSFKMPSTFSPLPQGSCLALPSWGGHGPTVSILPCPCSSCIQPFPALSTPKMFPFSFVSELSWHDLIKGWLKRAVQSGSSPRCPFIFFLWITRSWT